MPDGIENTNDIQNNSGSGIGTGDNNTGTNVDAGNNGGDNTNTGTTTVGNDAIDKRLDALIADTTRPGPQQTQQTQQQPNGSKAPNAQTGTTAQRTGQQTQQRTQQQQTQTRQQGGQQQQIDPTAGQSTFTPRYYGAAFKVDQNRNVIDAKTGQIVALAGAERKAFDRVLPLINNMRTELDTASAALESARTSNALAAKLNLSPEEFSTGARIMAVFKSNPKEAIRFMLQEAQNNGIDTSDLGGGGGLSINVIEGLLEKKLAAVLEPFKFITEDRQQQIQRQEAEGQAAQAIEEFFAVNPDARIHSDSIAKIMNAKPGTSLTEANLILQNHALRNGLDWTKPLVPQIQARVAGNNSGNNNSTGTLIPANTGQTRPIPDMNGRATGTGIVPKTPAAIAATASTGDIVKQAMAAAGMDISQI